MLPLYDGERDLQLLHFVQRAPSRARLASQTAPNIGLTVSNGSEDKSDSLSCVC